MQRLQSKLTAWLVIWHNLVLEFDKDVTLSGSLFVPCLKPLLHNIRKYLIIKQSLKLVKVTDYADDVNTIVFSTEVQQETKGLCFTNIHVLSKEHMVKISCKTIPQK